MQLPWTIGEQTFWLLLALALGVLWVSLAASLIAWVYRDASARGSDSPAGWALAVFGLPIPFLPWYLYRRHTSLSARTRPATTVDRLLGTWVTASLASFVVGTVVSPPDPFSQIIYWGVALLVTLPIAYVLVYQGGYDRLTGGPGGRTREEQ